MHLTITVEKPNSLYSYPHREEVRQKVPPTSQRMGPSYRKARSSFFDLDTGLLEFELDLIATQRNQLHHFLYGMICEEVRATPSENRHARDLHSSADELRSGTIIELGSLNRIQILNPLRQGLQYSLATRLRISISDSKSFPKISGLKP